MEILIVEDDDFKLLKIKEIIQNTIEDSEVITKTNVHDAILFLLDNVPDIIFLDMSLPSHSVKPGEGSPVSLPTGGLEIIFELRSKELYEIPILILTQYPDIEIEQEYYSISESKEQLSKQYNMKELQVAYFEDYSEEWVKKTQEFLGSL